MLGSLGWVETMIVVGFILIVGLAIAYGVKVLEKRDQESFMNAESQGAKHIVVTSTKSVGVSLILTLLFGPLGMLYSTISGGIIMMIISVVLALITAGFSLVITWPICVIWGAMAVSGSNRRILGQVSKGS